MLGSTSALCLEQTTALVGRAGCENWLISDTPCWIPVLPEFVFLHAWTSPRVAVTRQSSEAADVAGC